MNLEEKNSREIEEFLKSKGAEVVGFASLEGIKNVPKEYPNSISKGVSKQYLDWNSNRKGSIENHLYR